MTYTIKEIAKLAGVTTRTLRYYDEIGLLSPADMGSNGYRYYDQDSLLLLQQILFYRELEVPLKEIHQIVSRPDFELLDALEKHRTSLIGQVNRLDTLIDTIDQTIAMIKGEVKMTDKEYFEGFDEAQYAEETKERWGETPKYAESQKKWSGYTKAQKEEIKRLGGQIIERMVTTNPDVSPDAPGVQAAVGEYYAYLNKNFYSCEVGFLRGLADMWAEDPRFAKNYDRVREGGAVFVREAVHIYCDQNE